MTDSMKFGPEWLRNMSNDMNTSSTSSSVSSTAPLGPRYQLAEYRYGREEMLSLFDKSLKMPEILPSFKKLFVDRVQCPLALTPSTEDEVVNSTQRPWIQRSPVSFGAPIRGTGRGGSVDRGRGRSSRPAYYNALGFQRPTALYDEDIRGLGRGERCWPERNGGTEVCTGSSGEWNGSPSSSPRKEYSTHGRGSIMENWRRNRAEDDAAGSEGWRGTSGTANNTVSYRWSRSTSWRDEDSSGLGPTGEAGPIPAISRSFSSSANPSLGSERNNAGLSNPNFKPNSSHMNSNDGQKENNSQWDQDDMLPEWAMENPTDSGGSFDASGAFHGSNEDNDDDGHIESNNRKESNTDGDMNAKRNDDIKHDNDSNPLDMVVLDKNKKIERPPSNNTSSSTDDGKNTIQQNIDQNENNHQKESIDNKIKDTSQLLPHASHLILGHTSIKPPPVSEISDRMQEVADDMVEKLIMDDELLTLAVSNSKLAQKTAASSASNSAAVPILKKNSAPTNSPTTASLLQQQPLVNSHTLINQPQPQQSHSSELWYYRDPQGKVQGPFTASEMAEWYRAGYFDENLYVRRVCDSRYAALGELVKLCGNTMPFLSSHLIPPLVSEIPATPVPHVSQSAQPAQQQNSINTKQNVNVNPMLGQNDISARLHLQYIQKEYLLRQQTSILAKLAATEPWSMLSPEQQQQLVNQQMSQVVIPEHLTNLSPIGNSLSMVNQSTYVLQQIMAAAKNDMPQSKPPPQLHPLNPFAPTHNEFNSAPSIHNILQANPAPQAGMNQPPLLHSGTSLENDPIKSLLMQLQMQKDMQSAAPPSAMQNKWPTGGIVQPQQTWPPGNNGNPPANVSMWDFGPITHNNKPEMKTEQQIIEEQMQNEKLVRHTDIIKERVQHLENEQVKQQLQQQISKKEQQHQEKAKQLAEDKLSKSQKHDDESKKTKSKSGDSKKENAQSKRSQQQSEEDRKKDIAEERKKQKEDKKRQQLEDEKKRQMQLEEEKRRQILEEKKRQDEIDQHRRAKMLENTVPKPAKQMYEVGGNNVGGRIASSVAPWSNSGLPGITAPGPNFAEIQKAERERRAEEHRLEQILEHQRKSQQMELQIQKDNSLKWNAQPIKSLNVKSLAEIQAEEHKRQLASEQSSAGIAATEQTKRQEEINSVQSSVYGNNNNNNFGSIWNSRSSQNIAWNGKTAWSNTSSAGFWEEPTKIQTNVGYAKQQPQQQQQQHQQVSAGARLSKSQTITNMQSVKNNNNSNLSKQPFHNQAITSSHAIHNITTNVNTPPSGNNGTKATKPIKTVGLNQITKNSTTPASSAISVVNNILNAKKDDARNEFTSWCIKTLSSMNSSVDVPTFIAFLQDIESPYEVKDYIRLYLGDGKECTEFAKQFLERRSKYKNQQRAQNAHIDDMCVPAPAINPSSNDFQEVKGKGKKLKKGKMMKLDARILGFSVTAAQDRINVGDRDYGDAS